MLSKDNEMAFRAIEMTINDNETQANYNTCGLNHKTINK